jgi:5-methylcytosine-specific restriction endonuclease McrA
MSSRPPELDRAVRARARFRCEYCHLPARLSRLPFHIDHIVPHKHGGATDLGNLAFACAYCIRCKSANLSGRAASWRSKETPTKLHSNAPMGTQRVGELNQASCEY